MRWRARARSRAREQAATARAFAARRHLVPLEDRRRERRELEVVVALQRGQWHLHAKTWRCWPLPWLVATGRALEALGHVRLEDARRDALLDHVELDVAVAHIDVRHAPRLLLDGVEQEREQLVCVVLHRVARHVVGLGSPRQHPLRLTHSGRLLRRPVVAQQLEKRRHQSSSHRAVVLQRIDEGLAARHRLDDRGKVAALARSLAGATRASRAPTTRAALTTTCCPSRWA